MEPPQCVPRWIKLAYTLFVCLLVPVYTLGHGVGNFLWFSNGALLTTTVALWRESARLASMMALAVLLPELGWNLSFFLRLFLGIDLLGLTGYMFDPEAPMLLRLLSLYHIPLPVLLVWLVCRLGYDQAAFQWQTGLAWVILPLSYLASTGDRNINWTRGLRGEAQAWLPESLHLLFLMIAFPILIYLPTHCLLSKWFKEPACRSERNLGDGTGELVRWLRSSRIGCSQLRKKASAIGKDGAGGRSGLDSG